MENAKIDVGSELPRAEDIIAQLERILASESFNLPDRAKRFLRYVVTETVEGRSHYLKAYTIATTVFGRRNFDAQSDPAVRIEAGRIRRGLEHYYLISGPGEPVIITIPKGGYVPAFEWGMETRATPIMEEAAPAPIIPVETLPEISVKLPVSDTFWSAPRLLTAGLSLFFAAVILAVVVQSFFHETANPDFGDGRATIAVETFSYPSDDEKLQSIAQGTTAELVANLVKFNEVLVIAAADQSDGQQPFDARYRLEGTLRNHEDKFRSGVRLVRQSDRAVIWATSYDMDLTIQTALEAESEVAEKIATAVARPFGVIFSSDGSVSTGWEAYECALAYYNYRRAMTAPALATAQGCLISLGQSNPKDATSMALLSLTQIDQVRFAEKLGSPAPTEVLAKAAELAQRAAMIDPQNARVLQALMLSYFFNNNVDAALDAGAAAYALNPNDTEVAGEYGLRLAFSGRWETGCELVSKAVNDGGGPTGYYEVGMALCAFMRGDLQAAELWSRMSDLSYNPMHRVVLVTILGASGKTSQARHELDWLQAHAPSLMQNIGSQVKGRLARPIDQEKIFSGLRAAGAEISVSPSLNQSN